MDSTNADALYVRGLCLYYEDCIDKAVQFFVQALRMAPDHEKARLACRVMLILFIFLMCVISHRCTYLKLSESNLYGILFSDPLKGAAKRKLLKFRELYFNP